MIYPVGNGTEEDFEDKWYVAQGYGNPTTYGFHDGIDLNLKTGGDTDLGQELKSIASGRIVYYHCASHPTTGFGRHLVYRIEGPWGVRWVHYAHCLDTGFLGAIQDVPEGKIIAYLGKSGTTAAHLHMAIFKVDPGTFGIDNIPNTLDELHQYWEDPLAFLTQWTQAAPTPIFTDQTLIPIGGIYGSPELQALRSMLISKDADILAKNTEIESLKTKIQNVKNILG